MSIYLTGSLAYDRIMNFPGKFADHILPDKIHTLNVCFLIGSMVEKLGGTAGNIAYSLSLMGEQPVIVSSVGRDFDRYRTVMNTWGLSQEGLREDTEEFTAGAYITTDLSNNQITGFNPGAMRKPSTYSFPRLGGEGDYVVVSPTNTEDMTNHARLCKEKGARCIFDPGQQIPALSGEQLVEAITGSFMLICNDYELELISKATGKSRMDLSSLTNCLIVTWGEKGSTVYQGGGQTSISAVPPCRVADPTGAGDAYRAGLLKGLVQGKSIVEAARIGSACASFCVEQQGTQEHHFTWDELMERHRKHFA